MKIILNKSVKKFKENQKSVKELKFIKRKDKTCSFKKLKKKNDRFPLAFLFFICKKNVEL